MMKIISKNSVLILAALGFAACGGGTNTANSTSNANSIKVSPNTAVVVDSNSTNSNLMPNSNAVAPMNSSSNMSSNMSKTVSSADKDFMNKAAQGGMAEVKLGELAASKAQNADVKQFGQQMVTDHTKANNDLKTLAAGKGVTLPTDVNAEQKTMYDKLSKLSGAAFDKEYVKGMVEDHEKDVADFTKQSESAADSDLKTFAAKTLPTLKSHLDMIKGINGKMK